MYLRSSKFDAAIKRSHKTAARALFRTDTGQTIWDTDSTTAPLKILVDGELTVTSDSIRRTAEITLVGTITDAQVEDLNNQAYPWQFWRGVVYPDGTSELGSLGILFMETYYQDDSGKSTRHRLSLADESAIVADHKLTQTLGYVGDPVQAAMRLLQTASPSIQFAPVEASGSPFASSRNYVFDMQVDPWAKALEILRDTGLICYFNNQGLVSIDDIGSPTSGPPVWSFIEGADAIFMNIQRTSNRRRYNHVIVRAEAPGLAGPIIGHAYDTDPSSPSFYYGPAGDLPYFVDSGTVTSQIMADTVAWTIMQQLLGRRDAVTFSCVVNPFFEVGDVIYLQRTNAGLTGYYIIDRLSYPLITDRPMYITVRRGRTQ